MKCAIQQGLLSLVIIAMLTSASLANSLVSSYEDNALDNQNRAAGIFFCFTAISFTEMFRLWPSSNTIGKFILERI